MIYVYFYFKCEYVYFCKCGYVYVLSEYVYVCECGYVYVCRVARGNSALWGQVVPLPFFPQFIENEVFVINKENITYFEKFDVLKYYEPLFF